jgi:RNA polymerase sigma factor (sigma-70 family)
VSTAHLAAVLRHLRHAATSPQAREASDAVLLEQLSRHRDQGAFEELVRRHGPLVWRICRRLLGDAHRAEDAFQATFLVLAQKASAIRNPAALPGWLYGVAYRIAHRARAERQRRDSEPCIDPVDAAPGPASQATWRELGRIVEEEVAALSEALRLPVLLCYWEGLTNEEAARRLGWRPGTVKTRLARARHVLHTRLLARGVALPVGVVAVLLAPDSVRGCVPTAVVAATVRNAVASWAGKLAPAGVAVLTRGALPRVAGGKLKLAAVLVLGAATLAAGVLAPRGRPAKTTAPPNEAAPPRVERRDRLDDPLPAGAVVCFGTVRLRHAGEVSQVVFSPNGKLLASASKDATVRLWEAATGKELRYLTGQDSWIDCVAFSPDGKTLAAGYHGSRGIESGHPVILWDVKTGKELARLQGHGSEVGAVVFSPDGKTLASAGYGKSIRLWDVAARKERARLQVSEPGISTLAFSPDNRLLASVGTDKLIRL